MLPLSLTLMIRNSLNLRISLNLILLVCLRNAFLNRAPTLNQIEKENLFLSITRWLGNPLNLYKRINLF